MYRSPNSWVETDKPAHPKTLGTNDTVASEPITETER